MLTRVPSWPPSPPLLLQGEAALSASLQEETHLRALVRQLEDDLLRSSGVNSMTADAPASSSSLPADVVHPPGTPDSGNEAPPAVGAAVDAGGASGGLLEIVVGQRDRFRQRALQLEEEKGECEVVGVVFRWLGSSSWRRRGVSDRWLEVFSGWCHSG